MNLRRINGPVEVFKEIQPYIAWRDNDYIPESIAVLCGETVDPWRIIFAR